MNKIDPLQLQLEFHSAQFQLQLHFQFQPQVEFFAKAAIIITSHLHCQQHHAEQHVVHWQCYHQ